MNQLRIAVAKGRPLEEVVKLFSRCGIEFSSDPISSRQLSIMSSDQSLELVVVRGADVAVYLQYGAVDLGIVGYDMLIEHGMQDIFELLDLKLATCRMVVAGSAGIKLEPYRHYKVATKYPNYARSWFYRQNVYVEPIRLYGSVELAPLTGLSDLIVDLTSSGQTLQVNGLVVLKELLPISSRLITNRVLYKVRQERIDAFAAQLSSQIDSSSA